MIRKILKKALVVLTGLMLICTGIRQTYAQELSIQVVKPFGILTDLNNKWVIGLTRANNMGYTFDFYSQLSIQGQKVYCLQPLQAVENNNGGYTAMDLGTYFGNAALTRRLEYISALGYGYNNDYSSEMDFATQIRIWQEISPGLITHIHPDIQAKIDTINQRLRIMETDASFDNQTVVLHGYGESFAQTLTDTSGVLPYYSLLSSSVQMTRDNNTLKVWMNQSDGSEGQISMRCFYTAVGTSIAYRNPYGYQDVGYISGGTANTLNLNVRVETGSIRIRKADSLTGSTAQGEASLLNAQYELIDNQTGQSAGILQIGSDLSSNTIADLPTDRTYTLKEIQAPQGYQLSQAEVLIDFSEGIDQVLTMEDDVITGRFEIHKIITDGLTSGPVENEEGAEFTAVLKKYVQQYGSVEQAITHKDEFGQNEWDILVTDESGHALSKDLAYGTYVVAQTDGDANTEWLQDTFEFKVNSENQPVQEYTINNKPMKFDLRLVKVDADTGEPVVYTSALFKIFDQNGDPVTVKIGTKTYDTFATASEQGTTAAGTFVAQDEKGMVIAPLSLRAGTYTVQEVQAPSGYLLSDPVEVQIDSQYVLPGTDSVNPLIEVVIKDQKPTGTILLTKSFEEGGPENVCEQEVIFKLTAAQDIVDPQTGQTVYKAGESISTASDPDGLYVLSGDTLKIEGLMMGSYVLQEVQTREGYALEDETMRFVFEPKDDETQTIVLKEELENKKLKIGTSVQDENGTSVFYNEEDLKVTDVVSFEGLDPARTYTLTGTIKDVETGQTVTVEGKELTSEITFTPETVNGSIENVFSFNAEELANRNLVVFESLYCEEGHLIASHEDLNDEGQQFYVREILDLKVNKIDARTKQNITSGNFMFALYADKDCKEEVSKAVIDTDQGTAFFENLTYGTWYIKETQAPKGYILSSKVYEVQIDEDGLTFNGEPQTSKDHVVSVSVENTAMPTVHTRAVSNGPMWALIALCSGLGLALGVLEYRRRQNRA